jgi:hypothetical protein
MQLASQAVKGGYDGRRPSVPGQTVARTSRSSCGQPGPVSEAAGGPDPSLAQAYRIELFERAVSAFLARTDVPSLAVSHLHGELRIGQLAWLDQTLSFKGTATALAAVERGRSGRATFSGPLATDENVRVYGEYNAERLTGSSSLVQLNGRQRQFLLGYVHSMTAGKSGCAP